MKRENKDVIIILITIIVFGPLFLMVRLPWIIKAYKRYVSNKDNSYYTFYDYYTDVRHESKSFNKRWREMASKGIYWD